MAKDIDWINSIMEELVNPEYKLSDTILKVKILANRLNSEKLKNWVEDEINGYIGKDVPEYRILNVGIYGNLLQERGFGGFLTQNNYQLPLHCVPDDLKVVIKKTPLRVSISELVPKRRVFCREIRNYG